MKKLSLLIDEQAELIKYLEEMCDILKAFGYSVKNAVELIKLGNI